MTKDGLIKENQVLVKQNEELTEKLGRCEREVIKTCDANKRLTQKMIDMNIKFYGSKAKVL